MPTGLTAGVADGKVTTFREFALICARQMGACIMQRDDAMSEPPKLQEPSTYNRDALKKAEERLVHLQAMTPADAAKEADAERIESEKQRHEWRNKQRITKDRYQAMHERVQQWKPPTTEHEGLRRLMLEQLRESIKFDCDGEYWKAEEPPKTGEQWLAEQRAKAAKDIAYYTVEHEAEVSRTEGRNRWITQLYESLSDA